MSRKCDRAKYQRRAKDARANRGQRQHRLLLAEAEHRRKVEKHHRRELEARKRDPRYQLLGQLVGILAAPNWPDTWEDLRAAVGRGHRVDFNQGLDIRFLDAEQAQRLAALSCKVYRFSYDSPRIERQVRRGIKLMADAGVSPTRLSFYVLAGFPGDDTAVERMRTLAGLRVQVFPMLYRDRDGSLPARREWVGGDLALHGSPGNILKFLRVFGRLPE